MLRLVSLLLISLLTLSACAAPPIDGSSSSGSSTKVYRIRSGETAKLQYRMLDSVNSLRSASGAAPVQLNGSLNSAAATHARDMSIQNRPWLWSSDGSSPIDRARRAGFTGTFIGEVISESYETEIETLGAWMEDPGARSVILDSTAANMGFAWFQENNGKIWWSLVMGGGAGPI